MNSIILAKLASIFLDKKRIISWVSAVLFSIAAAAVGMAQPDFKDAVCGAPNIEEKK